MNITTMGIREQRNMLDRHDISTKELTECYLERIERLDPELQSYITVTKEKALQDAEKAQKKLMLVQLHRFVGFHLPLRIISVQRGYEQLVLLRCWRTLSHLIVQL